MIFVNINKSCSNGSFNTFKFLNIIIFCGIPISRSIIDLRNKNVVLKSFFYFTLTKQIFENLYGDLRCDLR